MLVIIYYWLLLLYFQIHLTHVPINEHGVTQFKSDSLMFRITQNTTTMQTLHLQVKTHPGKNAVSQITDYI